MTRKLRAYAVFGGGGMRGAALAGALAAAQELGIDFIGYGGVSAGSVIALLAAAGYTGAELTKLLTQDAGLAKLLDDGGDNLYAIGQAFDQIQKARYGVGIFAAAGRFFWSHRKLIARILLGFGLYTGKPATDFLRELIIAKNPNLSAASDISFGALREAVHPHPHEQTKLKILATDLITGREVVFPDEKQPDTDLLNASVIDAVRASIGYPLVFQPTRLGDKFLLDGGLSSGLPVFLFEPEFRRTKVPIIAFELSDGMRARDPNSRSYTFYHFISDLVDAASNSSDETKRITTEGIYPIQLSIRQDLGLHFRASKETLARMASEGHFQALTQLQRVMELQPWAEERRKRLAGHVRLLLRSLVHQIEDKTDLTHCRAYVMLRTAEGRRKVRYHFRMEGDADRNMAIGLEDGPSGLAMLKNEVILTELEPFRVRDASSTDLPPLSQIAIITAPLREYWGTPGPVAGPELKLLGTVSVDFTASPSGSLSPMDVVVKEFDDHVKAIMEQWADIISVQLGYESLIDGE